MKINILFVMFFSGFIFSTGFGQKNRYGMALTGSVGNYKLRDSAKICPLIDGGYNALPPDAFMLYTPNQPDLKNDIDHKQYTTLKFIYKAYDTVSLNMEVDIPKATKGPFPFIIWVHGGGWENGNHSSFKNQSTYLASRGIAGVRIAYSTISKGGTFNKGMQELVDAFEFVKEHAAEWEFDMTRFGYAGGSAGTPLAALAALNHNGNGCKLFMGCNGIYDFTSNLQGSFGRSSPYLDAYPDLGSRTVISPIHNIPQIASNIPAVLVFCGTADFTISYLQSVAFCDAVVARGGNAEKNIYNNYVHGFYVRGGSDAYELILKKMYAFASSVFEIGIP